MKCRDEFQIDRNYQIGERIQRNYSFRMGRRGDVNMVRVFVWLAAGAVIPAGVASPGIAAGAKAALAQTTEQSAANMVSRTTKAFNYRAAGGSTETLMAGTDLMRGASGTIKV